MGNDLTTDILISIYKRENEQLANKYFRTQTRFDDYVSSFCKEGGYKETDLNDTQLGEIAYNFIEYDNK